MKLSTYLSICFVSIALFVALCLLSSSFPKVEAGGSVFEYIKTSETGNLYSTSTASYVGSATSTLTFDPGAGELIELFLASYSTNTPPHVTWQLELSNNNSDWYPHETLSASKAVAVASGARGDVWGWSAATTTDNETVFKAVTLSTDFAAKFARIRYAGSKASTLHLEVVVRKGI